MKIKKLEFTKEQKKEYEKLKIVVGVVGIAGLILTFLFYVCEYSDFSKITITITLAFLIIYTYSKYKKILSKGRKTKEYSNFQKEIYSKAFIFFLIPITIGGLIIVFLSFEYEVSPWWLLVYFAIVGVIIGIWAALYEKKRFGAIMRAP